MKYVLVPVVSASRNDAKEQAFLSSREGKKIKKELDQNLKNEAKALEELVKKLGTRRDAKYKISVAKSNSKVKVKELKNTYKKTITQWCKDNPEKFQKYLDSNDITIEKPKAKQGIVAYLGYWRTDAKDTSSKLPFPGRNVGTKATAEQKQEYRDWIASLLKGRRVVHYHGNAPCRKCGKPAGSGEITTKPIKVGDSGNTITFIIPQGYYDHYLERHNIAPFIRMYNAIQQGDWQGVLDRLVDFGDGLAVIY